MTLSYFWRLASSVPPLFSWFIRIAATRRAIFRSVRAAFDPANAAALRRAISFGVAISSGSARHHSPFWYCAFPAIYRLNPARLAKKWDSFASARHF